MSRILTGSRERERTVGGLSPSATMKHVWLPTLGVWAQAHGMPSERGMTSAEPSTGLSAERREDSAKTALCCGRQEQYRYHDCLCSPDGGHQNVSHGDGELHCHVHLRSDQGRYHEHDDHSRKHECDVGHRLQRHPHDCHGYCKSCDDPHHTCPICLSSITQSDLTVLRWCMHRFCLTCIEKWSSMQSFCPLCKQTFHGWYYNIQSPSLFEKKDLTIKSSSKASSQRHAQGRRERVLVSRPHISKPSSSRRPLRRTWDRPGGVAEGEGDEQALQWRGSIYKKKLRAVPFVLNRKVKVHQAPLSDHERKARIERRLEPWICRELQAITGDLNHMLLVQLVLSLWLRFLSEIEQVSECGSAGQRHNRVPHAAFRDLDAIRQLEPFLQEKAASFWHELRCFAESPYSLRAYDSVIKYEKYRG